LRKKAALNETFKKEDAMEKKIVILLHPGLPYRKTIRYANERARDMGAKLLLLSVIPDVSNSYNMSVAVYEFGPYEKVSSRMEQDITGFLERAIQFCLDNGITADTRVEKGEIEEVIKKVVRDRNVRLVVVPTPTKEVHHAAFIEAIRDFAHNMLDHELKCPVVSVLAT
jgi:nucleotide-binding universal stress UspA family protein